MSAKSERERRRDERLAAEKAAAASDRRRLILGYVVAGRADARRGGRAGDRDRQRRRLDQPGRRRGDSRGRPHPGPQRLPARRRRPDGREGTPPPALAAGRPRRPRPRRPAASSQLDLEDEGNDPHHQGERDPRLRDQPADLGQPQPAAARRRRLQRDARALVLRPLARARPDRDPVLARPPRGGSARAQGRLRRGPRRGAVVPQPRDAVRGRGHRLDAADDLRQATRARRPSTRSATSATPTSGSAPSRCRSPSPNSACTPAFSGAPDRRRRGPGESMVGVAC